MGNSQKEYTPERRFIEVMLRAALAVCVLAGLLLVAAAAYPIEAGVNTDLQTNDDLRPLPPTDSNIQPLVRLMAGSRLIRPSQVQPAVKDNGAAQRMLEQLRLTGILELGGDRVAYIEVLKGGQKGGAAETRAVRTNEKILEFTVDAVEQDQVTLNLEGVIVPLRYR